MVPKRSLKEYLKGAENVVRLLGIGKGDEALIIHTAKTKRSEIEAIAYATRLVGAHVSTLEVEEKVPDQPYPPVIMATARGIDFRILMGSGPSSLEKEGMLMAYDYGVAEVVISPGFLNHEAGRYPIELYYEINNRLKRLIGHKNPNKRHIVNLKVVDDNGSDFGIKARYPEDIGAYIGTEPLLSGGGPYPRHIFRGGFPMGLVPMGDLLDSGNGVLVAEYFGRFMKPIAPLKKFMRFVFEDGIAKDIQGGVEAKALKAQLEGHPNANHLREFAIGTNPHIPLPKDCPAGASAPGAVWRAGNLSWGLGGDSGVSGRRVPSPNFSMPMSFTGIPTIHADGEMIVNKGKLTVLEDPELWKSAKKYGDPKKLLTNI